MKQKVTNKIESIFWSDEQDYKYSWNHFQNKERKNKKGLPVQISEPQKRCCQTLKTKENTQQSATFNFVIRVANSQYVSFYV